MTRLFLFLSLLLCSGLFKDAVGIADYIDFSSMMTSECLTKHYTKDGSLSLVTRRLTGTEKSHRKTQSEKGYIGTEILTRDLLHTKQVC